jgi:hypothetical protein
MKTNNGSLKKASKMDRNQAIRNTEGAIACKNFLSMANLMAKNCKQKKEHALLKTGVISI